jgi:hypothetical protein
MKRLGLLILLSASYAGTLTFVFSTDYSRENSFLLPEAPPKAAAKRFELPVMADFVALAERIATFDMTAQHLLSNGATTQYSGQSPESAH